MSKWLDIYNDLSDGIETVIVGYETEEQEDGITIAVVIHKTKTVDYYDEDARIDEYAQEKIKEVLDGIKADESVMEKKFVRVDIVDNDMDYGFNKVMDTYILINPNMKKLKEFQEKLDNRYHEENEFDGNYGSIHDYIVANFEILTIADYVEIEW